MIGRRRNRDDVGMTLFPFMAVLICTMGALIMLLVVMVQQARVRAKETASVDQQAVFASEIAEKEALAQHRQRHLQIEAVVAQQEKELAAHEAKKHRADEVQAEIEELRWQAEILRPSYDGTVADLADQRLALSHLEQHTRELSQKASKMQAEADLIARTAAEGEK